MKTPTYMLVADVTLNLPNGEVQVLPKGSLVSPIEYRWIPKYIKDKNFSFDENLKVYCHTKYGLVPIYREHMVKV